MEFQVVTSRKNEFIEEISTLCKKFKIENYELVWGPKTVLYVVVPSWEGGDFDVMGYNVTLVVDDYDKFLNTGFTYIGSIKTDMGAVFTTPSRYAIEKGFDLSSLKAEIEDFPCNDCGKKIARKIIHVFKEDSTGNITVYGSGCAKKRFGVDIASAVRKFSRLMHRVGERGYGQMPEAYMSAHDWTQIAYYYTTEFGYVSGSKAYQDEGVTSTNVDTHGMYDILNYGNDTSRYATEMRLTMPDTLAAMDYDFDAMIKWAVSWVDAMEDGDFKFNMNSALEVMIDGYILPNLSGYVAYMVFKYWYDNVKVQEAAKFVYNTDYSGLEVGDKFKNIRVEIVNEYIFEGNYGTTHIYTMKDLETGWKYKWFASKALDTELIINISSGTIKKFEDDAKYGKAIVVTRCRATESDEKAGDARFIKPQGSGA